VRPHCVTCVVMKSVLHYFKPPTKDKKEGIVLPFPHGPLSKEVPPGAIEVANDRVLSKLKPGPTESGNIQDASRRSYMKVSDVQRYCIAKRVALFWTTAAMKYFAARCPNDPQFASLKVTTVRR